MKNEIADGGSFGVAVKAAIVNVLVLYKTRGEALGDPDPAVRVDPFGVAVKAKWPISILNGRRTGRCRVRAACVAHGARVGTAPSGPDVGARRGVPERAIHRRAANACSAGAVG